MDAGIANYTVLDDQGSFEAEGIGFFYRYNAQSGKLYIRDKGGMLTREITPPERGSDKVRTYVRLFEKVTQIKALKMSQHTTLNLAEVFKE